MRRAAVPRALLPVALLATGGCALRSDIQVLQNDLAVMRAEAAQADSARRQQLERALTSVVAANDSLHSLSARFAKLQGDVQGSLYSMAQQLIQIQELTGQSQRRLQELRASLEQRGQEMAAPPPTSTPLAQPTPTPGGASGPTGVGVRSGAPASPTNPPVTPAGAGVSGASPGPNQLYQLSLDQLRRGSAGTARAGFQDLLRQYPTSDLAPDAQFYIAESFASEGKTASADSAYAAVVSRYPESPRAATALYKRALALQAGGSVAQARAVLEDVVRRYPRSDEAILARDRLRTLR